MSVDVSDPNIPAAYNEIISGALTDWLLLGYGDTNNKLSLYDTGSQGVNELRTHLGEEVLFGLIRVEGRFLLLVYMPDNVSGVKRARALVHSRAVGNVFKAHQATLTASRPSQVEEEDVREKLDLSPDGQTRVTKVTHLNSATYTAGIPPTPPPSVPRLSQASGEYRPPARESVGSSSFGNPPSSYDQRASIDSRASSSQQAPATTIHRSAINSLPLRVSSISVPPSDAPSGLSLPGGSGLTSTEDTAPPPPPKPKYIQRDSSTSVPYIEPVPGNGTSYQQGIAKASSPMLPTGLYSTSPEGSRLGATEAQVSPRSQRSFGDIRSVTPQTEAQRQAARSRAKWEAEEQAAGSPTGSPRPTRIDSAAYVEAERLRRDQELRDRAQLDVEERRRLEVEDFRRLEATHRLKLEEARRAAVARQKRQEAERQAAIERQNQEAEMDRRRQRDEAERRQQQAEEEKRLQREKWNAQRASLEEKFKQLQVDGKVMLTGWASHQVGIIWRRRYFELRPDCLLLFKNAEAITRPLGALSTGDIRDVADARDELQLPNSLRVDFEAQEPAFFYCDSQEDKEVFVVALRQAAGL